ncbi:hypothetical protein BH20ACI3_BH20ACI3_34460 [soil metagenome]
MKRPFLLPAAFLIIALTASFAAAFPGNSSRNSSGDSDLTPVNNQDVLVLVESKVGTDVIVQLIKTSPCTFDTFPPVLREMKRRGVPEAVLQAMVEAPYGPSENNAADELAQQPIYHYIEQLKLMGFLTPTTSGRRVPTRQSRARASRRQR